MQGSLVVDSRADDAQKWCFVRTGSINLGCGQGFAAKYCEKPLPCPIHGADDAQKPGPDVRRVAAALLAALTDPHDGR